MIYRDPLWKALDFVVNISPAQETGSFLKIGFTLSKSPNLHRAYLATVHKRMSMTVAKFSLNYSGVLNKGASKFLDFSLRDNLLFHSSGLLYFQFFYWFGQLMVLWKLTMRHNSLLQGRSIVGLSNNDTSLSNVF